MNLPAKWQWFYEARYGMFIHFGPYSAIGLGEQSLFRDHFDQREYEKLACQWSPRHMDAKLWAQHALAGGFKYAVLTTRHHDGYCLWDSHLTNYTSVQQAPKRDFVREYVDAFRAAGLRVGLYYSLADWRIPAYWSDPEKDPAAWSTFRDYVHGQVRELLTSYGPIDEFWFDGAWPHSARHWESEKLLAMMRSLQPSLLINNRLDACSPFSPATGAVEAAGESKILGDFGTPEHHITAESNRPWESCQTTTHRLWGYAPGEHWRTAEQLLDMLCDAASKGGNLLLNVGPDADGRLPDAFLQRSARIGKWLSLHREALINTDPNPRGGTDITEFVTHGFQSVRGNHLYLILRFYHPSGQLRIADLATRVTGATLLSTGQPLPFTQNDDALIITGLPATQPCDLYPVIKLTCADTPAAKPWMRERLWSGDPTRFRDWAAARGHGFNASP